MNIFTNTNSKLAYTVSKAIGSNNLNVSIQNGNIVIEAPWYYSKRRIQEVVQEKKKWILEKVKESEERAILKKDSNLIKSTRIFGIDYSINISYSDTQDIVLNLENDYIDILLPNNFKTTDNSKLVETILNKMYYSIAQTEIENIMERIRLLLGFAPEDFEIKNIQNYLAKFDDKNKTITINPCILMYKKQIIEFIIFHQFCHIEHKTHSKKFTQLMKFHIPRYEKLLKQTHDLKF